MKRALHFHLSRRESQIVDALYSLTEGSVEDVRKRLPDPVSYDSVRLTLGILERKGHVVHREDGVRFIYRPAVAVERAKRSVLRHVLKTFFGGSAPKAVLALLELSGETLSAEELDEISEKIDEAARKSKKGQS